MGLQIEEIEKRNLKWNVHLNRMNNERKTKKYMKFDIREEEDGEGQVRNGFKNILENDTG